MRGPPDPLGAIIHHFLPDDLIPAAHSLRRMKAHAEAALREPERGFRTMSIEGEAGRRYRPGNS